MATVKGGLPLTPERVNDPYRPLLSCAHSRLREFPFALFRASVDHTSQVCGDEGS